MVRPPFGRGRKKAAHPRTRLTIFALLMALITIVSPSYQQAAFLPECLASVHDQQGAEVEHIVVDGGSTDGSADLLSEAAGQLEWWVSEKDRGQSHAINKGLAHATGDVFNWINSDDALLPGALRTVAEAFDQDPSLVVLLGRLVHQVNGADRPVTRVNDPADERRLFLDPVINQQATFYRMDVVKAIGGVEEKLHFVMDYELWLQVLFRHGTTHLRSVPQDLAMFRLHTDSKTMTVHARFVDELASVLYGPCVAAGHLELAGILAAGHELRKGLRPLPIAPHHAVLVRDMVVYFLLKWHGVIHRREQFGMMRRLLSAVDLSPERADPVLAERIRRLEHQLEPPTWSAFRLRRKLRHLWG